MCTSSSMGGHNGVHLFRSPVLVLAEKKEHRLSLVEPSTKRFGNAGESKLLLAALVGWEWSPSFSGVGTIR